MIRHDKLITELTNKRKAELRPQTKSYWSMPRIS